MGNSKEIIYYRSIAHSKDVFIVDSKKTHREFKEKLVKSSDLPIHNMWPSVFAIRYKGIGSSGSPDSSVKLLLAIKSNFHLLSFGIGIIKQKQKLTKQKRKCYAIMKMDYHAFLL